MSNLNEVIRTSGDVRRMLAQTMLDVRRGDIGADRGMVIASLAKELTSSLQTEVNVAKVRIQMLQAGENMGKLTNLGAMIIEQENSVPTISGETK